MGNSEVGHQNIGAGRIVDQESVRITKEIRNGDFLRQCRAERRRHKCPGKADRICIFSASSPTPACMGCWSICYGVPGTVQTARIDRGFFCMRSPMAATRRRSTGIELHPPGRSEDEGARRRAGGDASAGATTRWIATTAGRAWRRRIARCASAMARSSTAPKKRSAVLRSSHRAEHERRRVCHAVGHLRRRLTPRAIVKNGDSRHLLQLSRRSPARAHQSVRHRPTSPASIAAPMLKLFYCTMTAYETGLPVHVAYPKPPKMLNILGEYVQQEWVEAVPLRRDGEISARHVLLQRLPRRSLPRRRSADHPIAARSSTLRPDSRR